MTDKISMVANARQLYKTRALRAGEPFEVDSQQDAEDLEAIGFASRKKEDAAVAADAPASGDEADADEKEDAPAPTGITQTRSSEYYKGRRDHRNRK